jgi:hypothetical protein
MKRWDDQQGIERFAMADNDRHPGITMHKLPVGGGFAGLVFAVGSALIFILGLPSLWYFVALSGGLGVGIAVILRLVNKGRSERLKPLSILSMPDTARPVPPKQHGGPESLRDLRQAFPDPCPAAIQH